MSNDAASIINNNDQYEYGFHDDVEPEYSTGRGLTEETVRKISAAKHEPKWAARLPGLRPIRFIKNYRCQNLGQIYQS